jgi:hypothetical protein
MSAETPGRTGAGSGPDSSDGSDTDGGTGLSWVSTAKLLLSASAGAVLVVAGNTVDAALGRFFEVLPLWVVALVLAGALGLILGTWAVEHWHLEVSAARFRALVAAVRTRRVLRWSWLRRTTRRALARRWVRRTALVVAFLLGLPLGTAIWPHLSATVYESALDAGWTDCPAPVQVRLMTASEQVPALTGLVREFETADAAAALGGCYRADVTVYPTGVALDRLASAFSSNWREEDRPPSLGPRPDVWIPGSSADVDLVLRGLGVGIGPGPSGRAGYGRRADGEHLGFERFGPVASSPLVVAVPRQPAFSTGGVRLQQPVVSLLDGLRRSRAALAMPDALTSSAGLLHAVGLNRAGYPLHRLDPPPGAPLGLDGDNGLLCWYREHAARSSAAAAAVTTTAMLVSERALATYDAGRPLGGVCAAPVRPGDVSQLWPYYLRDNPALDFPFVGLVWRGQPSYLDGSGPCAGVAADQRRAEPDVRRQQAVCRLYRWLAGPGQKVLDAYGLRQVDGTWPEDYPGRSLVLPAFAGRPAEPPPAEAVLAARGAVSAAETSRRVLVAFDVSATMAHPAPGGGSRLAIGAGAVNQVLNRIRPKDSLLVWRFARGATGAQRRVGYLPAVDQPYDAQHIAEVDEVKRQVSAAVRAGPGVENGDFTALVPAAFDELAGQPFDPAARDVVVVVTDGQNEAEAAAAGRSALPKPPAGARLVVLMTDGTGQCGRTPAGRFMRQVAADWGGTCVDDPARLADAVMSG